MCGRSQALFLNSAVDALDPLVESWPLALAWRSDKDGAARLALHSADLLNINITPSAFRHGLCAWSVLSCLLWICVQYAGSEI